MNPLKVAVVGCGDIAFGYDQRLKHKGLHTHCAAIAASDRFLLVAVCDTEPKRADECARAYGVPNRYYSIDPLLAAGNVDVLAVCTPDHTHATIGHAAMAMGSLRAIVMEKPVATNSEEAMSLLAVAGEKDITVAVNYSRRHAPGIQQLQETIRGEKLRAIVGTYTKGVRHNGTHWLDLAEFLGGPIGKLSAHDTLGEGGDDPTLDIQFEFSGGGSGFLKGCAEKDFSLFEMDVLTDRGRYTLTDFGHQLATYRATESPTRVGYRELVAEGTKATGLDFALGRFWQDLAEALDHGRDPLSSGRNATRALCVAEKAMQAARSGMVESVV